MPEDNGEEGSTYIIVAGIEVRVRVKPDPLYTHTCTGCRTSFWYKKGHGSCSYDGEAHHLRVVCPWCDRGNYIECDEHSVPKKEGD